jgi:hypothetical protein
MRNKGTPHMMTQWEHYAFSRALTERVLAYLEVLDSKTAGGKLSKPQLRKDIEELRGALAEPRI